MSVGNVGQLSVDLLLSSLCGKAPPPPFSSVDHPALLPVASVDAADAKSDRIMTACQVYWMEKEKMYIFQVGKLP